jgi:tetratricopeptide (TPR) repeat protein
MRALLNEAPEEFRYRRRYVMLLKGRAIALRNLGDRNGALQHLRESLQKLQEMTATHPANAEVQALRHATLLALAALSLETADISGALEHNNQALAIAEASSSSISTDLYARWRLADSNSSLGQYYAALAANPRNTADQRLANWREARTRSQKALALWDDWSQHAVSSVFNTTRREQALGALNRCDVALSRLAVSPQ